MTNVSVPLRSLRLVGLASVVGWVAVLAWPHLAPAVTTISEGLFWSVPFVLATSLATFNNTLRVFDRIEEVVSRDLRDLSSDELACLNKTIESTGQLTASLLVNAFIVIVAGIAYFAIGAILAVPLPRSLPNWIQWARPEVIGIAIRFGLGVLATRILVIQFQAIPPMVAFYKFFTIDRHLRRNVGVGATADKSDESDKSPLDADVE